MDNSTWAANYTGQLDFILVGLFSQSKHPALLCVVIFVIFLTALSGNSILIFLIHSNAHLQPPMYFFYQPVVSHGCDVHFHHCAKDAHGQDHGCE